MLQIKCPYCGLRDETEFTCGGEAHIARPLSENELSDRDFADYLFYRDNPKGLFLERWRHAGGCRRWFNVARDTVSHHIIEVYEMGTQPKAQSARTAFSKSWRRKTAAEAAAQPATQTKQKTTQSKRSAGN
jgi:sarcosine oxidase subunit delta